jgi:hypothetical protein
MFGILEEEEMATLDLVQSKMRTVGEDYRTTTDIAWWENDSCGGRCQNNCDTTCDNSCEGSCLGGCSGECYM